MKESALKNFRRAFRFSQVPTRMLGNGEFAPLPQTDLQRRAENEIHRLGRRLSKRQGMTRRRFLRSACGMAAAFLAMNRVYGDIFSVDPAEAADAAAAEEKRAAFNRQFIFDVQLHFVHHDYSWRNLLSLRRYAEKFNPQLAGESLTLRKFKFKNFVKEVFLESQTTLGLLSGAPSDEASRWFLPNAAIAQARQMINSVAGSKRLFSHAVITPGQPGWLDAIDEAVEVHQPDSWKGYTIGDPLAPSQYPWRLDDEQHVYPAYEKFAKSGIRTVCVHKGLLPEDYRRSFPDTWRYAKVDDVGKAARDWPELNFVIYHSGLRPLRKFDDAYLQSFEDTGDIPWVTELAKIPAKYGVSNVYAELGTAFATSATTYPRHCAALLGTLIKGMGSDRVLWGTDSVWYGSPQWQIEAFRRIEIPPDLQERFGFQPLGPADGLVKNAVLGYNAARLYGVKLSEENAHLPAEDHLSQMKARWERGQTIIGELIR